MADFLPHKGATTSISASGTSANAKVRTNAEPNQPVRVMNAGTSFVFIATGSAGVTASTLDIPIPPSQPAEIVPLTQSDTHIAAATAGASLTLYLTPGSFIR
ncbi:MAG TPA: hypothetical protein VEA41_07300 [Salinarimonas sp.]|nr:hypothetical protein [Salinarimonas sp.]